MTPRVVTLRQFELRDFNDDTRLVCWLEADKRLKVGARLTLKGVPRRDWIVMKAYKTERTAADIDFNRRWKVGGLL